MWLNGGLPTCQSVSRSTGSILSQLYLNSRVSLFSAWCFFSLTSFHPGTLGARFNAYTQILATIKPKTRRSFTKSDFHYRPTVWSRLGITITRCVRIPLLSIPSKYNRVYISIICVQRYDRRLTSRVHSAIASDLWSLPLLTVLVRYRTFNRVWSKCIRVHSREPVSRPIKQQAHKSCTSRRYDCINIFISLAAED